MYFKNADGSESRLVLPFGCITELQQLEFLTEMKEDARLFHNSMTKGKSQHQAQEFFNNVWYPKSAFLEEGINRLTSKMGQVWDEEQRLYKKIRLPLTDNWPTSISLMDFTGVKSVDVPDPVENFNTFSISDTPGRLTINGPGNKVDFVGVTRDETVLLYRDLVGLGYLDADFEHLVDAEMTSLVGAGSVVIWSISNSIGDAKTIIDAAGDLIRITVQGSGAGYKFFLREDAGPTTDSTAETALGTTRYLKPKRDEAVGANGTMFCYVYQELARTTLLDTLSILLGAKIDFRYIYAVQSYDNGNAALTGTGFTQNLDFQEPAVTVQRPPLSRFVNDGITSGIHQGGITNA